MMKPSSLDNKNLFDVANILVGLGLLLSPWYLGYAAEPNAAPNAWITGSALVLIALAALFAFHQAEDWARLAVGLWTVISPWLLGFADLSNATTVHVLAGLIAAILAAMRLWFSGNRPFSTA
jgi:heme/copper-type cytochrome/quinol oxidase subunit 3